MLSRDRCVLDLVASIWVLAGAGMTYNFGWKTGIAFFVAAGMGGMLIGWGLSSIEQPCRGRHAGLSCKKPEDAFKGEVCFDAEQYMADFVSRVRGRIDLERKRGTDAHGLARAILHHAKSKEDADKHCFDAELDAQGLAYAILHHVEDEEDAGGKGIKLPRNMVDLASRVRGRIDLKWKQEVSAFKARLDEEKEARRSVEAEALDLAIAILRHAESGGDATGFSRHVVDLAARIKGRACDSN